MEHMSLEKDIKEIRELDEADTIFKAATRQELDKRHTDRIAALGPEYQRLANEVKGVKEVEEAYEEVLEKFRYHSNHGDRGIHYDGNFSDRVSYNIKMYASVNPKLYAEVEEKEKTEELDHFYWDTLSSSLIDLIDNFIQEDYPYLVEEWYQTGRSGGWLTLVLHNVGADDILSLIDDIESDSYLDGEVEMGDKIDEDIGEIIMYKQKLTKRISDLNAIGTLIQKQKKNLEKYIESKDFARDFYESYPAIEESTTGLNADINRLINQLYEETLFKPATSKEVKLRQTQLAHAEYLDRMKRREETRRRYRELPYTYEDIVRLPSYNQIMALGNVKDETTPVQKQHKTTSFRLVYGQPRKYKVNDEYGGYTVTDSGYKKYVVFSNGYVRYMTTSSFHVDQPAIIQKFPPANTLEEYSKLLEYQYGVMKRKIEKEEKRKELK